MLTLEANGAPAFIRIMSKIPRSDSNELIEVVDLNSCEVRSLKAYTVLANELDNAYPNNKYLHRDFRIRKFGHPPGKRYYEFEIKEIRVPEEFNLKFTKCYADYLKQQTSEEELDTPNEISKVLGFKDYEEYRRSSLWKTIRRRVKKRDNNLCVRCEGTYDKPADLVVHHRTYTLEVMRGENDDQLASVCVGCHNIIHFDDNGNRRPMRDWDKLLLEKDLSTNFPPPEIDLRRNFPKKPLNWNRMSAKQRYTWHCEGERLKYIRMLQLNSKPDWNTQLRKWLSSFGMDNDAIDQAIEAGSGRRKYIKS